MGLSLGSSSVKSLCVGSTAVSMVYIGSTKVWPIGLEPGTTFNFSYTGTVQSVDLPPGKYKLQCWGAQGGTSGGYASAVGSRGGYSEGILTLNQETTLYVFVGGTASGGIGESMYNGGWNGGGGAYGYCKYTSGDEFGYSCPAPGGGGTDICTVTSDMTYSNGYTQRSSESLLSRIIVAGGGAGGSYGHQEITSTVENETSLGSVAYNYGGDNGTNNGVYYAIYGMTPYESYTPNALISSSGTYGVTLSNVSETTEYFRYVIHDFINGGWPFISDVGTISNGSGHLKFNVDLETYPTGNYSHRIALYSYENAYSIPTADIELFKFETTTTTSTDSDYTASSGVGGGTSGGGSYPGTQTAGGNSHNDGGFGYGATQGAYNYMYCSGGAGGGWYGGGNSRADNTLATINHSGGGSGFVNTADNASSRPSGYTGLELDSGTTKAGNTSHPSVSGGTETGHMGNGYARITAVDDNGNIPSIPSGATIQWSTQTGTWNSSTQSSALDGQQWTCVSPGASSYTVIRCTFIGVTSITFNCVYQGESNFDYLTVGALDTACTRDNYGTSLKGTSGTAKDITFTCDTGQHFVEFCYSKDGSVDTAPDNATVYVKA